MPTHRIAITQPARTVVNSDMSVAIYADGKLLGTLKLSKGGADWTAPNARNARKSSWERFAEILAKG